MQLWPDDCFSLYLLTLRRIIQQIWEISGRMTAWPVFSRAHMVLCMAYQHIDLFLFQSWCCDTSMCMNVQQAPAIFMPFRKTMGHRKEDMSKCPTFFCCWWNSFIHFNLFIHNQRVVHLNPWHHHTVIFDPYITGQHFKGSIFCRRCVTQHKGI